MSRTCARWLMAVALSLGCATTVAADSGKVTTFSLDATFDPLTLSANVQAPFSFADRVYTVSPISRGDWDNKLLFGVGKLARDGQYVHEGQFYKPIYGAGRRYASCVFKGEVFLFHDQPFGADEFEVRYHRSSSPADAWTPGNPRGDLAGSERGRYLSIDRWVHTGLKAVVFNDRIYLFFFRDGYVNYATSTDGTRWQAQSPFGLVNDPLHAELAVTVTTRNGKPALCLAVGGSDKQRWYVHWFFMDPEGRWEYPASRDLYPTYMHVENCLSLASGSLPESASNWLQGTVVQLFGQSSAWWPSPDHRLRRTAMDVDTLRTAGMDVLDISALNRYDMVIPCDTLEVALPAQAKDEPRPGDFRKYILVFTMGLSDNLAQRAAVTSYESSYFRPDPRAPREFLTAAGHTPEYRQYWTLVGVIEGMPPFTRNGARPGPSLSEVEYGRSKEESWSVETSVEGSVMLTPGFKNKVVEVGTSIKYLFNVTLGLNRELKSSFATTFKAIAGNADGSLGYLIYSKPRFTSQRVTELSQNRKNQLNEYTVVGISNLDIGYETYKLDSPPPGMTRRAPSTDLRYWQEGRKDFFQDYSGMVRRPYNTMEVTSSSDARCTFSQTEKRSTKTMIGVEYAFSSKVKEGLGIDVSGSLGVRFNTSWQTSFNESVSARLSPIPEKEPKGQPGLEKLAVLPGWIVAEPGSLLPGVTPRPAWLPDAHKDQALVPWYMTWLVLDAYPKGVYPPPPATEAFPQWSLTGDPSADLLLFPQDRPGHGNELTVVRHRGEDQWEASTFAVDARRYRLYRLGYYSTRRQAYVVLYEKLGRSSLGLMQLPRRGRPVFLPLEDAVLPHGWQPVVLGDLFNDGQASLVLRDGSDGSLWLWELDADETGVSSREELVHAPGASLLFAGRGDFDGDGKLDLLLEDEESGAFRIWRNGQETDAGLVQLADARLAGLTFVGVGSFDGNGVSDLLLHDDQGQLVICLMREGAILAIGAIEWASSVGASNGVVELGDFDGDGITDIAFRQRPATGHLETCRIEYLAPLPIPPDGVGGLARVRRRERVAVETRGALTAGTGAPSEEPVPR